MAEQYKPQDNEQAVLAFWEKEKIYQQLRERNAGKKPFYYLDGPPYTTGRIHIGHAWGKALRDSILRYKRMAGFDVWDKPGFDMHGLPIEVQVEKELGIKDKREIFTYGVASFIKKCKEFALANMTPMIKDFQRLGVWLDWDSPYMTIKNEYIEGVWWALAEAHRKGLLYKGKRVMTWSPKSATALAKHELEYEMRKDPSLFLKFRLEGSEDTYLVVWTTTPWTIPFNMAVMVNPDADYVIAELETKEKWIVAKALHNAVIGAVAGKKFKVVKEMRGEALKGLRYDHPFREMQYHKARRKDTPNAYTVILSSEYVGMDAGTGLVHCAPGCGPEDFEVGKEHGIPPFNEVDENGVFGESMEAIKGLRAKEDDDKFIDILTKKGVVVDAGTLEHEYPHAWRSMEPCIFRVTDQWFIAVERLRDEMRQRNKKVHWNPDWAGNRWFDSWLGSLQDWCISRQRFWGIPLPIWENEDGDHILVGSREELQKLSGQTLDDLHRPYIDEVVIKHKGKIYKRVPDVLDVWLDSGAAPWATLDFPSNKQTIKRLGIPDLILEGKDQIRGWFNSLSALSMVSQGTIPFKAVYMHGFINDSQGRKFSKSLKNGVSPYEVIDQFGADTLRYYTIGGAAPGLDLSYNPKDVQLRGRNLLVLWNLHNFVLDLAQQCKQNPAELGEPLLSEMGIEERYMLSRINSATKKITQLFDDYQLNEVPKAVEDLFFDLSHTYIQLVREKAATDDDERRRVLHMSYVALERILRLFAPVCPFITEVMYLHLRDAFGLDEKSVHLLVWPKVDEKAIDVKIEARMKVAMQVLQATLFCREKAQQGVRWPLQRMNVVTQDKDTAGAIKVMRDVITTMANIKELTFNAPKGVTEKVTPNKPALGRAFGGLAKDVEAALNAADLPQLLATIRKESKATLEHAKGQADINLSHLNVVKETPKNVLSADFPGGTVYLDTTMTPQLEAEGFSRELTRRIQQLRKDAGLTKSQRADVIIQCDEAMHQPLEPHRTAMEQRTNADVHFGDVANAKHSAELTVKNKKFVVGLSTGA